VLTAPRCLPANGALGGLLLDAGGVTAVYGREIVTTERSWPARERFEPSADGFRGSAAGDA
jgi:hypothetical protein